MSCYTNNQIVLCPTANGIQACGQVCVEFIMNNYCAYEQSLTLPVIHIPWAYGQIVLRPTNNGVNHFVQIVHIYYANSGNTYGGVASVPIANIPWSNGQTVLHFTLNGMNVYVQAVWYTNTLEFRASVRIFNGPPLTNRNDRGYRNSNGPLGTNANARQQDPYASGNENNFNGRNHHIIPLHEEYHVNHRHTSGDLLDDIVDVFESVGYPQINF